MVNPVNNDVSVQANQHTEQALIELVYIQEANNLIGKAMANLDSALNTSQSVLNILQALQNLANDISVQDKSAFPFNFATGSALIPLPTVTGTRSTTVAGTGGGTRTTNVIRQTVLYVRSGGSNVATDYDHIYNRLASAYFGTPIDPIFVFSSQTAPGYAAFKSELETLKIQLRNEISVLFKQTPQDARQDPTSLLASLQKVYKDMPSNFAFSTVEKWALDNYDANANTSSLSLAAQAGSMQNDLTTAITAAESLNDTQKETVRQFLFIFQEYYQSASAVLSAITQVIEMMAQKISG